KSGGAGGGRLRRHAGAGARDRRAIPACAPGEADRRGPGGSNRQGVAGARRDDLSDCREPRERLEPRNSAARPRPDQAIGATGTSVVVSEAAAFMDRRRRPLSSASITFTRTVWPSFT